MQTETKKPIKKEASKEEKKPEVHTGEYLAAVRLRGDRQISPFIKDTLIKLNLKNQHNLIIVPKRSSFVGMLKKSKDYITWGEIDSSLKSEIESKKSEKTKNDETQKYFRLSPPRGGFERKGIKVSYSQGGALGYRGKEMAELLKRMM
jgi:large subunit ribosomal protein L30